VTGLAAALLASTDYQWLGAFLGGLGLSGITTSGVLAKARADAANATLIIDATVVRPRPSPPKSRWMIR
jgi:hypothetical protein